MSLWNWILMSDTFWNYVVYVYVILEASFAWWLSSKNEDKIMKYAIPIITLTSFFLEAYKLSFLNTAYLLFCLGRWIYRKIKDR